MSKIQPVAGFNDRTPLASVVPLQSPFTLNVFPTNLCNFRCNYCGQSLGMPVYKENYPHIGTHPSNMALDTLENVVKHSKKFVEPYKLVSFNGHGEPLVHTLLPDMVSKVKDAGIAERIEIITNASLLTHEYSRKLVDAGLDNIRISLQGLSGAKYKKICGVSIDFDAFIENIAYYHSYTTQRGGKVFVKIVDAALEEGEEELFYKMFDSISDRMYIERVFPIYEGVSYENLSNRNLIDRYGNEHKPRKVCPLPFYMLNIWPDGSVAPCDGIYRPLVLGNCNEDSLVDIWHGEQLRDFQIRLLSGKNTIEKCRPCCAPDDVSHPADVLDEHAEKIMAILKSKRLQ